MMRRLTALGAGLGVMLVASLANAQAAAPGGFGSQGQFILSADRLFPVFGYSRVSQNELGTLPPGVNKVVTTDTQTAIGFFWGGTGGFAVDVGGATAFDLPNFYTVPRLGFDYTIIDNVTLGGDLVLFFGVGGSHDVETDLNNGNQQTSSTGAPTVTLFGIAPRGGYIIPLSSMFAVWLRGGFSYYNLTGSQSFTDNNNNKTTVSAHVNQFAIDLDPQLVITPIPHFGFTAGLTGDIPIAGGHSVDVNVNGNTQSSSASSSIMFIGVTAGILGWFGGP